MSEVVHRGEILDQLNVETAKENPTSSRSASPSTDEWTYMTAERGYYRRGGIFIKRSLRPSEFKTTVRGTLHVPRLGKERLRNEAASLRFIREVSGIPVPTVYGSFEVDDSYFLIMEYVDGVGMSELSEEDKEVVCAELCQHQATLRKIKRNTIGGPSGILIPPYRVMRCRNNDTWTPRLPESAEYVFCHNDLSQHNVIVDPRTLKINAIIDWEYAGFFPQYFEAPFYKRPGPSVAINGESDDVRELLQLFEDSPSE